MNRLRLAFLLWIAAAPWLLFPGAMPLFTLLSLILLSGVRLWLGRRWGRVMAATPLNGLVLVYLLLSAMAFLLAPFPEAALPKLTTLLCGVFGYLLVLDWLWPPAGLNGQIAAETFPVRLTWLTGLLAIAGGLIVLGALFTVEWPQRQLWDLTLFTNRLPHLTGTFFVHPNEVAGTLLFLLPFALFLSWFPADTRPGGAQLANLGRIKILGRLLLLLMLAGLLLMQSRVALLALVGVALTYVVWGRWRLRWLLVGVAAVGLLFLLSSALLEVTPNQISFWVNEVDAVSKQGALAPQSWPMRQEIWAAASQTLADYPVFGAGLDSFVPVSRANYPFFNISAGLDFAHTHNLWLQSGADMGWPGVLATFLLLTIPLGGLWLAARSEQGHWPAIINPFGAGLAGYILFNLLDTISPLQRPGVLLWAMLAGSATILVWARTFDRRIHYVALVPLALLVFALFTPSAGQNWANWQFDRARLTGSRPPERGELLAQRQCIWWAYREEWPAAETCFAARPEQLIFIQSQGQQAAYAGRYDEALAWYNLALALDDRAASVYYWRGQLFAEEEAFALAQADYAQAIRFADHQGLDLSWQALFHYQLGRAHVRQQSWRQALQSFQTAVTLDDSRPWYFKALGDTFLMVGDKSGAQDAYERAGKK
jgi:O-antigen ligase